MNLNNGLVLQIRNVGSGIERNFDEICVTEIISRHFVKSRIHVIFRIVSVMGSTSVGVHYVYVVKRNSGFVRKWNEPFDLNTILIFALTGI